jgi:hypothetical protein
MRSGAIYREGRVWGKPQKKRWSCLTCKYIRKNAQGRGRLLCELSHKRVTQNWEPTKDFHAWSDTKPCLKYATKKQTESDGI